MLCCAPEDIEALRQHTEALCEKLYKLGAQLRDGSLVPADVKADFVGLYQPDALALADAMTVHLPDSKQIAIEYRNNQMRSVRLLDRPLISCVLQEYDAHTAGVQLQTIAGILRRLASSLRAPVNP